MPFPAPSGIERKKEKFDAVAEMPTDSFELGFDM
jgi:hypothetical protein